MTAEEKRLEWERQRNAETCPVHGRSAWIQSTGRGYCQRCAQENHPDAKIGEM